jgi:hypothetical protein
MADNVIVDTPSGRIADFLASNVTNQFDFSVIPWTR